jgi:cytoskeleton protein RodZ
MADSEAASQGANKDKKEGRAATVGERLRATRTAKGLSLEQLSTELRIEARQLAALERNDFAQIGVPVFIKGYLKQYALRLGLDPAEIIAAYQAQDDAHDVEILPSRTIKMRDERQITFWVVAFVVLLVLVALLAYWWIKEPMLTGASRSEAPALHVAAMVEVTRPSASDSTVSAH